MVRQVSVYFMERKNGWTAFRLTLSLIHISILNLRQTLASKILELEKDSIYNKYIDKVGTIINAEVYQILCRDFKDFRYTFFRVIFTSV